MATVRLLFIIDENAETSRLLRQSTELIHYLQAETGLLHIVDPGDISPASPYYDDIMEQFQRRGYRFLHQMHRYIPTAPGADYLRISRYPDRMIAAVANLFSADYIIMGNSPSWLENGQTLPEFLDKLVRLSRVPVLTFRDIQPAPAISYPLFYN